MKLKLLSLLFCSAFIFGQNTQNNPTSNHGINLSNSEQFFPHLIITVPVREHLDKDIGRIGQIMISPLIWTRIKEI